MPEQTTEQGPSLEDASSAIAGLLSPPEKRAPRETPPKATPTPEHAAETPPAGEAEETAAETAARDAAETAAAAESAAAVEGDDVDPEAPVIEPRKFKVKADGQELEVTEDELLKGYSRTADYTRKAQALAAERKTFEEGEKAKVIAERQTYSQYLDKIKEAIESTTPKEPNWEQLRGQVTPDVFAAEVLAWQTRTKNLEKVEAERKKVADDTRAEAEKGFKTYIADQTTKMREAIPDFADPVKGPKLQAELQEFGLNLGFTEDDLRSVTDHRLVIALHKAMQFDKAQANKPKVANKIEAALAASAPGSRTSAPKKNDLSVAKSRLAKSGSVEDGAAAIAALLG